MTRHDYAVVIEGAYGTETVATYDNLVDAEWHADAVPKSRVWRLSDETWPGHPQGALYAAIRGTAWVRPREKIRRRTRALRRRIVGWTRLVPVYAGNLWWRLETREKRECFPGEVVVGIEFGGRIRWGRTG